ncbi:MAG TPA: sigma-70 family RNA polymerase sigma factor [Phycisphaerae bacterium]|nr:sigma-70 family RNA polymerase sigma factor [Phycisphaerae bacterium]
MTEIAAQRRMDESEAEQFDAQAVARTLAGDLTAFDRLIEKYQRRAASVSYRLLGNLDDALEVTQEAFLKAFRSLGSLDEPTRFGPWLIRIVSNLSLNFRRGRHPGLSLATHEEDEGVHEDRIAGHVEAARDSLEASELSRAISKAIDGLPEQQRVALVLFALEAIPQKEVAAIMECSVEMVKWNVFQARKALKEKLTDYLEE